MKHKLFKSKSALPNSRNEGDTLWNDEKKYTLPREQVSELYKLAHLNFEEVSDTNKSDGGKAKPDEYIILTGITLTSPLNQREGIY